VRETLGREVGQVFRERQGPALMLVEIYLLPASALKLCYRAEIFDSAGTIDTSTVGQSLPAAGCVELT